MNWYRKIFASSREGLEYLELAVSACDFYENLYEEARKDVRVPNGTSLLTLQSKIAGMSEERWAQLQDLEAILQYMEERENVVRMEKVKNFAEHYQRNLSAKEARDYADVADEVQNLRLIRHRVAYVRDLYAGIFTALNVLQFQISNATKLKCAGLDDAVIDTRY